MTKPKISIIVAIGRDKEGRHVIGKQNELVWRIKDDLKRFKELTMGHPIIMGRKTFLSIVATLGKPLPGRTNIVVTRDEGFAYEGVVIAHSLEEAIAHAESIEDTEIFIGGGSEIYNAALPFGDRLYLTVIDDQAEGDAFFPDYESEFKGTIKEEHRVDQGTGLAYAWLDLERMKMK